MLFEKFDGQIKLLKFILKIDLDYIFQYFNCVDEMNLFVQKFKPYCSDDLSRLDGDLLGVLKKIKKYRTIKYLESSWEYHYVKCCLLLKLCRHHMALENKESFEVCRVAYEKTLESAQGSQEQTKLRMLQFALDYVRFFFKLSYSPTMSDLLSQKKYFTDQQLGFLQYLEFGQESFFRLKIAFGLIASFANNTGEAISLLKHAYLLFLTQLSQPQQQKEEILKLFSLCSYRLSKMYLQNKEDFISCTQITGKAIQYIEQHFPKEINEEFSQIYEKLIQVQSFAKWQQAIRDSSCDKGEQVASSSEINSRNSSKTLITHTRQDEVEEKKDTYHRQQSQNSYEIFNDFQLKMYIKQAALKQKKTVSTTRSSSCTTTQPTTSMRQNASNVHQTKVVDVSIKKKIIIDEIQKAKSFHQSIGCEQSQVKESTPKNINRLAKTASLFSFSNQNKLEPYLGLSTVTTTAQNYKNRTAKQSEQQNHYQKSQLTNISINNLITQDEQENSSRPLVTEHALTSRSGIKSNQQMIIDNERNNGQQKKAKFLLIRPSSSMGQLLLPTNQSKNKLQLSPRSPYGFSSQSSINRQGQGSIEFTKPCQPQTDRQQPTQSQGNCEILIKNLENRKLDMDQVYAISDYLQRKLKIKQKSGVEEKTYNTKQSQAEVSSCRTQQETSPQEFANLNTIIQQKQFRDTQITTRYFEQIHKLDTLNVMQSKLKQKIRCGIKDIMERDQPLYTITKMEGEVFDLARSAVVANKATTGTLATLNTEQKQSYQCCSQNSEQICSYQQQLQQQKQHQQCQQQQKHIQTTSSPLQMKMKLESNLPIASTTGITNTTYKQSQKKANSPFQAYRERKTSLIQQVTQFASFKLKMEASKKQLMLQQLQMSTLAKANTKVNTNSNNTKERDAKSSSSLSSSSSRVKKDQTTKNNNNNSLSQDSESSDVLSFGKSSRNIAINNFSGGLIGRKRGNITEMSNFDQQQLIQQCINLERVVRDSVQGKRNAILFCSEQQKEQGNLVMHRSTARTISILKQQLCISGSIRDSSVQQKYLNILVDVEHHKFCECFLSFEVKDSSSGQLFIQLFLSKYLSFIIDLSFAETAAKMDPMFNLFRRTSSTTWPQVDLVLDMYFAMTGVDQPILLPMNTNVAPIYFKKKQLQELDFYLIPVIAKKLKFFYQNFLYCLRRVSGKILTVEKEMQGLRQFQARLRLFNRLACGRRYLAVCGISDCCKSLGSLKGFVNARDSARCRVTLPNCQHIDIKRVLSKSKLKTFTEEFQIQCFQQISQTKSIKAYRVFTRKMQVKSRRQDKKRCFLCEFLRLQKSQTLSNQLLKQMFSRQFIVIQIAKFSKQANRFYIISLWMRAKVDTYSSNVLESLMIGGQQQQVRFYDKFSLFVNLYSAPRTCKNALLSTEQSAFLMRSQQNNILKRIKAEFLGAQIFPRYAIEIVEFFQRFSTIVNQSLEFIEQKEAINLNVVNGVEPFQSAVEGEDQMQINEDSNEVISNTKRSINTARGGSRSVTLSKGPSGAKITRKSQHQNICFNKNFAEACKTLRKEFYDSSQFNQGMTREQLKELQEEMERQEKMKEPQDLDEKPSNFLLNLVKGMPQFNYFLLKQKKLVIRVRGCHYLKILYLTALPVLPEERGRYQLVVDKKNIAEQNLNLLQRTLIFYMRATFWSGDQLYHNLTIGRIPILCNYLSEFDQSRGNRDYFNTRNSASENLEQGEQRLREGLGFMNLVTKKMQEMRDKTQGNAYANAKRQSRPPQRSTVQIKQNVFQSSQTMKELMLFYKAKCCIERLQHDIYSHRGQHVVANMTPLSQQHAVKFMLINNLKQMCKIRSHKVFYFILKFPGEGRFFARVHTFYDQVPQQQGEPQFFFVLRFSQVQQRNKHYQLIFSNADVSELLGTKGVEDPSRCNINEVTQLCQRLAQRIRFQRKNIFRQPLLIGHRKVAGSGENVSSTAAAQAVVAAASKTHGNAFQQFKSANVIKKQIYQKPSQKVKKGFHFVSSYRLSQRVILNQATRLAGEYAIATVARHYFLDVWIILLYFPKTCKRIQVYLNFDDILQFKTIYFTNPLSVFTRFKKIRSMITSYLQFCQQCELNRTSNSSSLKTNTNTNCGGGASASFLTPLDTVQNAARHQQQKQDTEKEEEKQQIKGQQINEEDQEEEAKSLHGDTLNQQELEKNKSQSKTRQILLDFSTILQQQINVNSMLCNDFIKNEFINTVRQQGETSVSHFAPCKKVQQAPCEGDFNQGGDSKASETNHNGMVNSIGINSSFPNHNSTGISIINNASAITTTTTVANKLSGGSKRVTIKKRESRNPFTKKIKFNNELQKMIEKSQKRRQYKVGLANQFNNLTTELNLGYNREEWGVRSECKNLHRLPGQEQIEIFCEIYIWQNILQELSVMQINGLKFVQIGASLMLPINEEYVSTYYIPQKQGEDLVVEFFFGRKQQGQNQSGTHQSMGTSLAQTSGNGSGQGGLPTSFIHSHELIPYVQANNYQFLLRILMVGRNALLHKIIGLREILNLYIAEGYYKFQTDYYNSKMIFTDLIALCEFVKFKIKYGSLTVFFREQSKFYHYMKDYTHKALNFLAREEMDNNDTFHSFTQIISRFPLIICQVVFYPFKNQVSVVCYSPQTLTSIKRFIPYELLLGIPFFWTFIKLRLYHQLGQKVVHFLKDSYIQKLVKPIQKKCSMKN